MTQIFSNYHRRELMTFTQKIGSSLSYAYDLEQNKEAKEEFEETCTDFLNKIDSTTHFWNINNLETMRKWGSMLKHEEKVIHFMTAMLDYVDNYHQTLDFYPQEDEHLLDISSLKYSSDDIGKLDKLGESVLNYCKQFEDSLPSETDEYLSSLANPPLNQENTVKCPTIANDTLPTKRLIDNSFEGNVPNQNNVKTTKHYHQVSQLYSNDMFQVKTFVDSIMKDYGLFSWEYLPKFECHPPTPLLFADKPNSIANEDVWQPHIYRNIWGIISNTASQSVQRTAKVTSNDKAIALLGTAVKYLIDESNGIDHAVSDLEVICSDVKNQLTIIYLFLAELYQKKELFHKALQAYERFFVAEASCNAPNKSLYLSVKLNQSITMLKAGQTIAVSAMQTVF